MTIKNASQICLLTLVYCVGLIFTMDGPIGEPEPLKDVDRVFLNACKNNKNIHLALSLGADRYVTDPDNGWSGMHYASKNGNIENVKFFLKNNTSQYGSVLDGLRETVLLGGTSNNKDYPMVIARNNGHRDIVQLLVDFSLLLSCRGLALHMSALSDFKKSVTGILTLGANINCIHENDTGDLAGFTPLHHLCLVGSEERVKFLLKKKANPNKKSGLGFTPLYVLFAKKVGGEDEALRYSLAKLLIKNGADVTINGPENRTVLQAAIDSGSPQSVEMLSKKINRLTSFVSAVYCSKSSTDKKAKNPTRKKPKNKHKRSEPAIETKTKVEEENVPKKQVPCAEQQDEKKILPKKTYAAAVCDSSANNVQTTQRQSVEHNQITIVDDHATITVPITQQTQPLMLLANQSNPVAGLPLLKKVQKKKDKIDDFFHNFSSRVEDQLGGFMRPKVLKKSTAKHSAITQYSTDATMMLHRTGSIFSGELQFIEQGNMITHRFFKPDQSSKKGSDKNNKKPLLLGSSSVDSKDALG